MLMLRLLGSIVWSVPAFLYLASRSARKTAQAPGDATR